MAAATDLGRMLREARERRGVSLRELAETTKIAFRVLEALERNDISRLPGGIFGRGFVRAYATAVGLDPETTVQTFIAQFPQESVTAGHPTAVVHEDHDAIESNRRAATTFLWLIAVSVPLLGVLAYFAMVGRRVPSPAATPSAATQGTVAPASARSDVALEPAPVVERLTVVLSATRACAVSVTVDGNKAVDGKLAPGDERSFDVRRELALTVDDGEAVRMTVNGAEANRLGEAGQAASVRIDLANFKTFLLQR